MRATSEPVLERLLKNRDLKFPVRCEIHVGEQYWQSNSINVIEHVGRLGVQVTVIPNAVHMRGKAYVCRVLD